MAQHFIDRFVRISNPLSDTYGQRGQVVAETGHNVTVRFADGSHQTRRMGTVAMDADQETPVWPPAEEIGIGAFVRVTNPGSVRYGHRGKVISVDEAGVLTLLLATGPFHTSRAMCRLDDDQTTPLDATMDQPTQ